MREEGRRILRMMAVLCVWLTVCTVMARETAFAGAKAGAMEGMGEWRKEETTRFEKQGGIYACGRCGWQFEANVPFHYCPLCGRKAE